jgi:hypothetical protein
VFDRRIARSHDTNGDGSVDSAEFYAHDGEDVLPGFSGCRRGQAGSCWRGGVFRRGLRCQKEALLPAAVREGDPRRAVR